jgi:predicted negative regulator of RcsB-dependent stress response
MTAQSVASRSRRSPRPDDGEDILVARAIAFTEWARRNRRLVIGAAVLVLVLVAGLLYYRYQQAERNERAATELFQMDQTAQFTAPSSLMEQLESFVRRYDGTRYADEARVLLARTALDEGDDVRAAAAVERMGSSPRRSPLHAQAGLLLGAAREGTGDVSGAENAYLEVARRARSELHRMDGYLGAAGVREAAGDHTGAAALYADAEQLAPEGSGERTLLEMRRVEAEHRAIGQ